MKFKEKVIGLNYYHNDGHDLDMVKEAGFNFTIGRRSDCVGCRKPCTRSFR